MSYRDGDELAYEESLAAREGSETAGTEQSAVEEKIPLGVKGVITPRSASDRRAIARHKEQLKKPVLERATLTKENLDLEKPYSSEKVKKQVKQPQPDTSTEIVKDVSQKTIFNIEIDTSIISHNGETRQFRIYGENNAAFSMMIFDDNSTVNYYDFGTKTWVTSEKRLKTKVITGSSYSNSISFPADGSRLNTYTIHIFAELNSKHIAFRPFFKADNTIDFKTSVGSDSNLFIRKLEQGVAKTLTMSCIAPTRGSIVTDTKDGAISSGTSLVMDTSYLTKGVRVGDKVSGTNINTSIAAVNVGGVADTYTIRAAPTGSVSDEASLAFEGPFASMTPRPAKSNDASDAGSTTGVQTFTNTIGKSYPKKSFSITLTATSARSFAIKRIPTTNDLCAFRTVTIGSAGKAIPGEDVSSSTYYRWPVDNIAGITNGMLLDPSKVTGANVTNNSTVKDYRESASYTIETVDKNGSISESSTSVVIEEIKGVDAEGNTPTLTNDIITAQAGNLTFSEKQADALKDDANVRIIGYGKDQIKSLTFGTEVELSNVKLTLTEITTTIDDSSATGSASLSDFDVASTTGIMLGTEVSGVNINTTSGTPKVTAISGSNLTVSPTGHLLQNGQTLTFSGTSNIVTITGDIEIKKMGIENATIFFDVERFLFSDF